MRNATTALVSLLAIGLLAGVGSQAFAQRRFRQMLEQRREASHNAE